MQPQNYSGPDNATAAVAGSCSDQAGNVRNASFGLKYDATPPQTSASPARAAGPTGWYIAPIQVSFTAADATSGVANCDAAKTYAGPDASAATVSGSCRDNAGNSDAGSLPLKYDATAPQVTAAPSRPANAAGWYTAPLSVSFSGGDATSGLDSCDPQKSFSGPDSATAAVAGTCRDQAGNTGGTSLALKYDATAPLTTAAPSRQPNANGWFNAALTVSFTATDATSTVDSCDAAKGYSGPDIAATTVAGSCRDKAGNSSSASYAVKYDATPPQTAAAPSRQPNAAGWYTAPLTVGFSATDATSTVDSCDAAKGYSGPDIGSTTVTGACRDKAGNSDAAGFALKYDATAPVASATPSRQPNAAGWYRAPLTVSFAATDATSGLASCPAPKDYAGPDNGSASVTGTCLDVAGNAATPSLLLKYDATAPQANATASRPADFGGWFNHALTVNFAATDATSGVASCPAPKSYSGPDDAAASVGGTCLDVAGNPATPSLALKYDATAPQATATPARPANGNGWYNAPVPVGFAGTDATAGLASCDALKTYSGPDSALAAVVGSCQDRAGNTGATSFGLKYDATVPQTTATPGRVPDSNGWYRAPLTVSFAGTDATAGIESCDPPKNYSGPDNAGASVNGSCRDLAGNSAARSFVLGYDATAPQVTGASPARPTDANGWFNHPVAVAFAGTDATSGIAAGACTQLTYGGPDNAAASVNGVCRDRAGNESGTSAFGLKYDGTAPVASAAAGRPADANGWYNHALTVQLHGLGCDLRAPVLPGATELRWARQRVCDGERHVPRPRRQQRRPVLGVQVRRNRARSDHDPGARSGRQRLVQPAGLRRLLRQRRAFWSPVLPGGGELPGSRQQYRRCQRYVSGQGGERRAGFAPPQVRRHRTDGPWRALEAGRRERLVQPLTDGGLRRLGCDVRHRFVHVVERLRGPGRRHRLEERDVHGPGGQPERRHHVPVQVRRDGAADRKPGPGEAAGPGRVVQPAGRVRRAGNRRNVRHRLLPAPELHRSGQRGGIVRRRLSRQGRQPRDEVVHAQLRRDGPGDDGDCRPPARLERLVQPPARRQLLGHGRGLGNRFLLDPGELHGARLGRGGRRRCLRRQGGERRARVALGELRRDCSGRHRRRARPNAGRERLVQPAARRRVPGQRRHLGDRELHAGGLRGAGLAGRERHRLLQRPCGECRWLAAVRAALRRHRTGDRRSCE